MKNKTVKTLVALSFFIAGPWLTTSANASTYSSSAEISNISLNFSSMNQSDIYFFDNQKNSYSQARADNATPITTTATNTDSDYLIPGWGITNASMSYGSASSGSTGASATTSTSINASASAYSTYGAESISADAYGAHWINFYTFNPLTVTVSFDYLLSQGTNYLNEGMSTSGSTLAQVEARFYASADGSTWDIAPVESLFINLDDPWAGLDITLSHDFLDMSKKYGRFEILAYSSASVNAVPIPAAVWLLGSSLLGMIAVGKKQSLKLSQTT